MASYGPHCKTVLIRRKSVIPLFVITPFAVHRSLPFSSLVSETQDINNDNNKNRFERRWRKPASWFYVEPDWGRGATTGRQHNAQGLLSRLSKTDRRSSKFSQIIFFHSWAWEKRYYLHKKYITKNENSLFIDKKRTNHWSIMDQHLVWYPLASMTAAILHGMDS